MVMCMFSQLITGLELVVINKYVFCICCIGLFWSKWESSPSECLQWPTYLTYYWKTASLLCFGIFNDVWLWHFCWQKALQALNPSFEHNYTDGSFDDFLFCFVLTRCQYILLLLYSMKLKLESQSCLPRHQLPKMLFRSDAWHCIDDVHIIQKLIFMGLWADMKVAILPHVTAFVLILLTLLHTLWTWQQTIALIHSILSVLRIQGSERRTRPAWSGVTRRSRTQGATR